MPSPSRARRRFGRIRKLPSGRYQAGYTGPDGAVHNAEQTFPTKAMAERWLSLTEADVMRGEWSPPERCAETVGEWAERWWRRDHLRPSTALRDDGYLRRYILPTLGTAPLASLDRECVQAWIDDLANRLAPATVRRSHQLLGQLVDAAVTDGILKARPWVGVALPRIVHEEMRFLTPTELERLADAMDERYRSLVLTAGYGGLRMGEVAGLRRKHVGRDGTLTIIETAVEAEGVVRFGPPKTRAGRRSVRLPKVAAEALGAHLATIPTTPDAWVFPAPDGGVLRLASWRTRFWRPAVAAAGLAPLRPHDLRHTAVAIWIAAGLGPLEVSRRAGHASTSFTLDRYGHLFPGSEAESVAKLDGYLSPPIARILHAPPTSG